MVQKSVRRYDLTTQKKEAVEAWLNDEITAAEGALATGFTTGDNFKAMVATVVKHLVLDGSLNMTQALKKY